MDDNNQLTYSAAINIHVPGGIAGLEVDVSSPVLSMLGISKLNLFNDSEVIEGISFADLGLSCQTEIQYKKECVFDITALVPMILLLGPDPGSEHVFDVKVTDLAGQVTEQSLTFTAPALVRVDQTDLWKNTASLTISNQFAGRRQRRTGVPHQGRKRMERRQRLRAERRRQPHGPDQPRLDHRHQRSGADDP